MTRTIKWILVVLLGVIVLAIIAGLVFAFLGAARYGVVGPGIRTVQPFQYHQMIGYRGLGAIFGGLLALGVFILVIIGIVALVSALFRNNRPAQITPPSQPPAPVRTCPNCGKPAQEDWKTCPYCGTSLT
jgi:hypothetical protein